MSLIDGGPGITVPGIVQNLALDTSEGKVHSNTQYVLGKLGQQPEADIILGETLAHGAIRVMSADPRYYDALMEAAAKCAAFLREGQIRSAA